MKEIKYIGFYDTSKNKDENRNYFLSATNKMNYVANSLIKAGYKVQIISPSWTNNNKFYKAKKMEISKNITVKLFPTIPRGYSYFKVLSSFFSNICLFLFLLKNIQRNEKIIVYHSLSLIWPLSIIIKIKKAKMILEVEEIYSEVWKQKKNSNKKEMNYFLLADKFILVSDKLKNKFNKDRSIVLYGEYRMADNLYVNKREKDVIKLVYAGTIDEFKGGALKAVKAMEFLPDNYKLTIMGFGSSKDKNKLEEEIKRINKDCLKIKCKFIGIKTGKKYDEILFNCNIGLNSQNTGEYMNSAFPSKILSYLSHDLIVVSTNVTSIVNSKLAPLIYFTNDDSPEELAKTISTIDINKSNRNSEFVKQLDDEFVENLKLFINE